MQAALVEAQQAAADGEVPIGCVLVDENGGLVSAGRNRVESKFDCTCHAEMECLRTGMASRRNWRLLRTTLYSTLEPCAMCLGAIQLARVERLVFGADDLRLGAVHSWVKLTDAQHPFHDLRAEGGLLAQESSALLKSFFRDRRVQDACAADDK